MMKWIILAGLVILAAGCASDKSTAKKKKDPTQKELAVQQWKAARAAVLVGLARDQFQSGNLDKARLTLNDALKLDAENVSLRIMSARLAIEQGQLELADRELKIARTVDPKNAEADYYTGVVYQRWQKPQEAFDCYRAAAEKNTGELAYVLAESEMLVTMDRPQEALDLLQERTSAFENNATLRDAIAQILVQRGRYEEAVQTLRRASALAGEDLTIREHLGMALFYNKQYRESGEVLSRLLKDENYIKRADLFTALGECYSRTGSPRDARAAFETAVRLQPTNGKAWLSMGRIAMEIKDTERAEIALKKAVMLEPGNSESHLMLGYLRLRQNRYNEALASFRKAAAIAPADGTSLCMIGFTLERMGKGDQAVQFYGQALKIKPDDELAAKLMAGVEFKE